MALKVKVTVVPERYQAKLTEHILRSRDYTIAEKGAVMARGADGRFRNPLTPAVEHSDDGQQQPAD